MAKGVVHRFEAVEVDIQQRQGRAATQRGQVLLEVITQATAVGQPGQCVMLRQVLNPRLCPGLLGHVAGGAAVAEQLAVVLDGARSQPAIALAAIGGAVAAAQRCAVGRLEPILQRRAVGDQQLQQRAAQPLCRFVAGDLPETVGKEGQARLFVGLPDPVGRRFRHIAEALLALGQR